MKFKVYSKDGKFLGFINGKDSNEALSEAKLFDMQGADHVIPIIMPKVQPFRFKKKPLPN